MALCCLHALSGFRDSSPVSDPRRGFHGGFGDEEGEASSHAHGGLTGRRSPLFISSLGAAAPAAAVSLRTSGSAARGPREPPAARPQVRVLFRSDVDLLGR